MPSTDTLTCVMSLPSPSFAEKTTVGIRGSRSESHREQSLTIQSLQAGLAHARIFSRASSSLSPADECTSRSACS